MSLLKDKLKRLISSGGPLSVADYMAMCLFDPEAGYYTTREPFGADGDFTTAPEISQMFGELVAVWALAAWRAAGRPTPAMLAEIGPGRGTLMADMLRTLSRLDPAFVILSRIGMIEASPRLAAIQREKLAIGKAKPSWFADVESLPHMPLVIVGNELFDALPVRQFVKGENGWRERMVSLDADGELCFAIGMTGLDPALLPPGAQSAPPGAIFELAPARTALMDAIAARIETGSVFDVMGTPEYDGIFAHPGEADLTSHVDFAALAAIARGRGLEVRLATQGDFLLGMGLLERAGVLGANGDEPMRERLQGEVQRLAGPEAMGTLFKVMAVTPKGMALPPFDTAD